MKIGQEIIVKEDLTIKSMLSKNIIHIKVGDKALVTKLGIKYLSGEGRGKIKIDNKKDNISGYDIVSGYDIENISKRIALKIKNEFGYDFDYYLEENELIMQDLIDIIEDELSEYI